MKLFYENRLAIINENNPISIYENSNFSYFAHWHSEVELAFVTSGTICIGINNERRILAEGDIAICCSGDIHYYESTDSTSTLLIIIFKPEVVGYSQKWPEARHFVTPYVTNDSLHPLPLLQIRDILNSLIIENKEQKSFYEMLIKGQIIELCALLLRNFVSISLDKKIQDKHTSSLELMHKIIMYVEENFAMDITLKKTATHFHMDLFNLSKKFSTVTGMNFKTYINTLRVLKAESMIKNSSLPITDIAFECGFNSIRSFNRVYKFQKGCTPSSLRE